ncbi:MAG: hypothetical protein HYY54_05440 [candidate division NC10 bacterium]|nr:hypothetical protein [candidate division NC10 bacterium]
MRGRCQCGGAIAFAHEDLGCLQCGEACCPACAFRPEGHVFCPACTGRMLARGRDTEPVPLRPSPLVRPAGMPRLAPARPTPLPTSPLP